MIDPILETVLRNLTPQERRDARDYLNLLIAHSDKTATPAQPGATPQPATRPTFKQPPPLDN